MEPFGLVGILGLKSLLGNCQQKNVVKLHLRITKTTDVTPGGSAEFPLRGTAYRGVLLDGGARVWIYSQHHKFEVGQVLNGWFAGIDSQIRDDQTGDSHLALVPVYIKEG